MKYKENKINNIDELRLEIVRLKLLQKSQETYLGNQYELLKEKVDAPIRFVNKAISWIPGVDVIQELFSSDNSDGKKDWVSRIFSAGSTALLNRLFLRKSGLLKRLLLSTVTQQAAGLMNQSRLTSLIKSLADYIRPSEQAERKARKKDRTNKAAAKSGVYTAPDFGIPPDSEAS